MQKQLVGRNSDTGTIETILVDMTAEEITAFEDERTPSLADAQAARTAAVWAELQSRLEVASVAVTTAAGTYSYGLDPVTQDNLAKAVLGVLIGTTPDPRAWTPRGETLPISISHAEVQAIAAAVGLAYEAHMQAYLAHKAAIRALTTVAAVEAYDIADGWPA